MKQEPIESTKLLSTLGIEIFNSFQSLIQSILELPSNYENLKKINGAGGLISVRDTLAYQIGWGKLLIGWYEEGLAGEAPEMPGEGFSSWDYKRIALHFYQKYRMQGLQMQLLVFEKIVKTIIEITEKEHARGSLEKIGVWPWCTLKSGKQWPLSKWIRVNTIAPYKKASTGIRKLKNS